MKLFLLILFFINNLIAQESFSSIVKIKETNNNGIVLYEKEKNILFNNNKIKEDIKYKKVLKVILKRINVSEKQYIGENLFLIYSINDEHENIWTLTVTVKSKDISISHFISKHNNKIINGWINRDNKDLFGLRLFN
jgi:hypothetical protein